jgi:hypothetical protein
VGYGSGERERYRSARLDRRQSPWRGGGAAGRGGGSRGSAGWPGREREAAEAQAQAQGQEEEHQQPEQKPEYKHEPDHGRRETPPLPNLAIVEASTAITGAGVISATTACPPGFVAIGGGFDVNGADPTGLVGEGPIELANGWAWQVSVNLTSAGTDASIDTFAICLEAHIVVET